MTYIPSCKEKYEKDTGLFPCRASTIISETTINPYWEGLLRGENADVIRGLDFGIKIIDRLFNDFDEYDEELELIGINVDDIDFYAISDYFKRNPFNIDAEELKKMSSSTRAILIMKYIISMHIEMQRDDLVITMIENMDDTEYEAALKEASETD